MLVHNAIFANSIPVKCILGAPKMIKLAHVSNRKWRTENIHKTNSVKIYHTLELSIAKLKLITYK